MEIVTKEYLEDNIKSYDKYRGLDKIGKANGIANLDASGKVPLTQIPDGVGNDVKYGNKIITSIAAGSNIALSESNGALTIRGTVGVPAVLSSSTAAGGKATISAPASGVSKADVFLKGDGTWSNIPVTTTTAAGTFIAARAIPANTALSTVTDGTYYAVEIDNNGKAAVKVPNELPTGGNTNQVLKKTSSGVAWEDISGSGSDRWDNTGINKITVDLNKTSTLKVSYGEFFSPIIKFPASVKYAKIFTDNYVSSTSVEPGCFLMDMNREVNINNCSVPKSKTSYVTMIFTNGTHTYYGTICFNYGLKGIEPIVIV